MKKFWGRGSSSSSASSVRNGSTSSLNKVGSSSAPSSRLPSITKKKSTSDSSPSMILPSRKQRMQLLKCIIHHADAVQNKYLLPKDLSDPNAPKPQQSIMSIDNMSSMFSTDKATAEINEKCYQRWHEVLQEGLVPMSVHALNLLQKSTTVGVGDDDEEEAYFATMEGMDEEIQVMAILARAAALNDLPADSSEDGNAAQDMKDKDGMEQINAMMKCIAMLLFHIVLQASSSSGSNEGNVADSSNEEFKTVAGYDGRVRHVTKLACVDVLSRAIIDSVETFEKANGSIDEANINEDQSTDGPIDIDDYSLWNMANIKSFLDQENFGKDAIFGTVFYKRKASGTDGGETLMLENKGGKKKQDKRQSQSESNEEQSVTSGNTSKQSQPSEAEEHDAGEIPNTVESIDTMNTGSSSFEIESESFEVESEEIKFPEVDGDDNSHGSNQSKDTTQSLEQEMENLEQELDDNITEDGSSEQTGPGVLCEEDGKKIKEEQDDTVDEVQTKRHSNAKYLATRKFELIERLVAIDIVRFLMAEEREVKIRQQELEQQKINANKLPAYLRRMDKDTDDAGDDATKDDDADSLGEDNADATSEGDKVTNSQFFTASRVKQMKRSAKIAGMGLALGTVFAITGGLAAPALAAGIGGIAALTGATTASSTALLAVLATFKAGAALFGVGGGGLAAYKMKKRTAGLSQFEIRRENIEQYMYMGASDESMKKGIEAMLPQLHTTVAVSGWLRDNDIADFQLAWGVQPTCQYEKSDDDKRKIREMKRFYSVYNPPLVHLCGHFMETLQKRLKKDFCWDRIWDQLEQKYGANPDHMIPLDSPHENEVYLSYEEKEMIDGVLNDAKLFNLKKRGLGMRDEIDFDEDDEITELLAKMSPKKGHRKTYTADSDTVLEVDLDAMENELGDLALSGSKDEAEAGSDLTENGIFKVDENEGVGSKSSGNGCEAPGSPTLQERMAKQREQQASFLRDNGLVYDKPDNEEEEEEEKEEESENIKTTDLSVDIPAGAEDDNDGVSEEVSPSLHERMTKQREQQVSFLKDKGLIDDESKLQEGAGSPKMLGSPHDSDAQDPPVKSGQGEEEVDEFEDETCPVVWDWKRLYGTADLHTVTWESKMLSSLCHIVENMALEVSSQATKVALQYSVIGAIISAVAIPSALVTASKLIDDPYQIVVIRADEAGKELAKCLLQSDERRPVTLVGFSFGARVIYSCLRELARQQDIWEDNRAPKSNNNKVEGKKSSFLKKKSTEESLRFQYDREPASLVADVIFIGLPRAIDKKVLTSCRRVTGGRLVNCYTTNDWLLSLMFVARGGTPCGCKPIKDVPGVENYDVTSFVETHTKYADAVPSILQHVRFSEPP